MSTYLNNLQTDEGGIQVLTKSRYLLFISMPRTSVMPTSVTEFLKHPGTMIKWNTSDPATLAQLHEAIVIIAKKIGLTGMVEIAECWKAARHASDFAGTTWQKMLGDDVLQYVTAFV